MKLLSVNVGLPREVAWGDGKVETGIFKRPVSGRIALRRLNLDGDRQADLSVHGGEDKAVYGYPAEHYEFWRRELPDMDLPFGMFGENFTLEGLLEDATCVGDRFRIGTAELQVTQPRLPCYKLGIKFGRNDMVKRFLASGRTGFYFSVVREGEVGAGDGIELVSRDAGHVAIPEIARLYVTRHYNSGDLEVLRLVAGLEALPEAWRNYFRQRLEMAAS